MTDKENTEGQGTQLVGKRKEKPPVIPTPNVGINGRKPLHLKFHVGKDYMRKFEFPQMDARKAPTSVYHLYPTLAEWVGRTIPDGVNPRSHDVDCLKTPVAKAIEQTILEAPEDFVFANRGSTIIADHLEFDPKTGYVTVTITDPENQGLADGATTDAVIAKVQTALAREAMENKEANYSQFIEGITKGDKKDLDKIPENLKNARLHLEAIVGLQDRARLANLVQGRNTSRQVRGWSMSDFRGSFDWIKEILEAKDSPLKDKVGYEENSGKDMTVLDILSIVTLFHPEFDEKEDGKDKAPVVAYANKGRMDARLADEKLLEGYKKLSPLIVDILRLHDYVYANFEGAYDHVFGPKARLGRRPGVESRLMDNPYELPMTGLKSNYIIPAGFVFPLLASLRSLVNFPKNGGQAKWKIDPFKFFDKYGSELVSELIEQVEAQGGNPNVAGKRKLVYTAIHNKARLCYNDEMEERRGGKKD